MTAPANNLVSTIRPARLSTDAAYVRPSIETLWAWLSAVPDPEIPVVSVTDLGIVRNVGWSDDSSDTAVVTVTPTYSGCPATDVIGHQIREELMSHGVPNVDLRVQLSPAWTTDWLTDEAKQKLKAYGIAPPTETVAQPGGAMAASLLMLGLGAHTPSLVCPRCGSTENEMVSRFGSTPCKSLHRCLDCREPFDHFKCH